MVKTIAIGFFVAATSLAQVNFDIQTPSCTYAPPSPCGAFGDPEGISWNGNSAAASATLWPNTPTVDTVSGAGMPVSGPKFLRCPGAHPSASGTIPVGGPLPAGYDSSDVYIALP